MLHLVIDSSVYRADQKRASNAFRALGRLAKNHKVIVHVPYFVKREVVTQQQIAIEVAINEVRRAVDTITRTTNQSDIVAYATSTDGEAREMLAILQGLVNGDFDKWLADIDAEEYPVAGDHARSVAEAYFNGGAPFKKQKSREDIPDAFIWQSILDIVKENGKLHVVTADNALFGPANSHPDLVAHHKLDEFIQTPECQAAIKESWSDILEENIERAHSLLPSHADSLSGKVKTLLASSLVSRMIKDEEVPSFDNEAQIIETVEPSDIALSFDDVSYYGEVEIGIPFETIVDCVLEYAIYKGEYHRLPYTTTKHMRLEDRNENYFGVQQDHQIKVAGVLTLNLVDGRLGDITLTDPDLDRLISTAEQKISISEVELEW